MSLVAPPDVPGVANFCPYPINLQPVEGDPTFLHKPAWAAHLMETREYVEGCKGVEAVSPRITRSVKMPYRLDDGETSIIVIQEVGEYIAKLRDPHVMWKGCVYVPDPETTKFEDDVAIVTRLVQYKRKGRSLTRKEQMRYKY